MKSIFLSVSFLFLQTLTIPYATSVQIVDDHDNDVSCAAAKPSHLPLFNDNHKDEAGLDESARVLFVNILPGEKEAYHRHNHLSVMFFPTEAQGPEKFEWKNKNIPLMARANVFSFEGEISLKVGQKDVKFRTFFLRDEPSHSVTAGKGGLKALRVEYQYTPEKSGPFAFLATKDFETFAKEKSKLTFTKNEEKTLDQYKNHAISLLQTLNRDGKLDIYNLPWEDIEKARNSFIDRLFQN